MADEAVAHRARRGVVVLLPDAQLVVVAPGTR